MHDIHDPIADPCAEALPPAAITALEQFNAGDYYGQHDTFEALWMAETRPVRDLYRAVLQVGVGYYQITRGNLRGAWKMLSRADRWLAALPPTCQGIDVAGLRADAALVRETVRRAMDDAGDAPPIIDPALLKPVRWQ